MKNLVPLPHLFQDPTAALNAETRVVLFGAGIFAPLAIHALRLRGVTPACVCDNATAKHGTKLLEIPVRLPEEARAEFPDALVIITAAPHYIDEIRAQLINAGWTKIFDSVHLLASLEYDRTTFPSGVSELHYDLDRYFYDYFLRFYPERLVIPSLDVVITEKCSLKCRDCANLMQYYANPKDIDFDALFNALDHLMASVDHVLEFRVLGGEAFMNPHAHRYIERLRQYRNYTRIAVYANGTIVPRGENLQCLIHEKTYLRVTDYGTLSPKTRELEETFAANGVVFDTQPVDGWQDCAGITLRERTPEELNAVFLNCCANKTLTLLNGRLHVCPFAANASNLGAIPPFPQDILPLDGRMGKEELRSGVFRMLRTTKPFSACRYCAGRSLEESTLTAALQVPSPLPYRAFNSANDENRSFKPAHHSGVGREEIGNACILEKMPSDV